MFDQDMCLFSYFNTYSCHWLLNWSYVNFDSESYWLLVLHRNHKSFLISPVHKHFKKLVALLTKEKRLKNEWENDDPDFIQVLYSVYNVYNVYIFLFHTYSLTCLRLVCVHYSHQFFFLPNDSPSKTVKCFLFHLKCSFRFWGIQIFVFLSFRHFLPVGDCLREWSKINLKVYDIINCLNKNSIIHFVWYLEKETRYDIETLSTDGVLDKENFYGKIIQEMCRKSWFQTSL